MNAKGILRKDTFSTPKIRSLSTRITTHTQPTKTVQIINHNRCQNENVNKNHENIPASDQLASNAQPKTKYTVPELHSALLLAKKLDDLKIADAKPIETFDEMTPRTKAVATEKALKKLNFVPDRVLYKQLPPINVNDSVLEVHRTKPRHFKAKRDSASNKDPEPSLNDYLKPTAVLKYKLKLDKLENIIDEENNKQLFDQVNDNFRCMYEFYEEYLCPTQSSFSLVYNSS